MNSKFNRLGDDIKHYLGSQHPTKRKYHLTPSARFKVTEELLRKAKDTLEEEHRTNQLQDV